MVISLILVIVLFVLGIVGSRGARLEAQIARNDLHSKQALAIAEAGLDHAVSRLRTTGGNFDPTLAGGTGTGGVLATIGAQVSANGQSWRFRPFGGDGVRDGYFVRIEDNWETNADRTTDADGTVRVIARGRIARAERTIEEYVRLDAGPDCALTVHNRLDITGSVTITGRKGCAHTNHQVDQIAGNPTVEQGVTSSGTMRLAGQPTFESGKLDTQEKKTQYIATHELQPQVDLPAVQVFDFRPAGAAPGTGQNLGHLVRDAGGYLLGDDCKVYTGSWTCSPFLGCMGGTAIADARSANWNGWECKIDASILPPSQWKISQTNVVNAPLFVEGQVVMSVNVGTPATPWITTIVAMNSIDISSDPYLAPFTTTGPLRNLLLVSGNDIGIRGGLGSPNRPGAIFAHQQLRFSGNPTIYGFILAEDGRSTWPVGVDPAPFNNSRENLRSFNDFSGGVTIHYVGLDTEVIPGVFERFAWIDRRGD